VLRSRPRGPRAAAFLVWLAVCCSSLPVLASSADLELRLGRATFDPVRGLPSIPANLRIDVEPDGGIFVVQMRDPLRPDTLDRLRGTGARPLEYLPERAYVVRIPPGKVDAVRGLDVVRWVGPVQPDWKLSPELGVRPYADPSRRMAGRLVATIDLFPGEELDTARDAVVATGADIVRAIEFGDTRRLEVRATPDQLEAVAWIESVAWIEEAAEITLRNNTARWVVQSNVSGVTSVWDHELHGEGQIIGHIDGRIDMNSCYFRDPVDNSPGPSHRKVVAYRSNSGQGADSHGTHTAGTSAGDQFPINGSTSNNGHAWAARISHTNLDDITGSDTDASNLYQNLAAAHQDGARLHTNSWGDDGTTAYTTWSRDIDRFSYDFEDSLVLFAATNLGSLRTPENAKNVLAVGASQNGNAAASFCSGGTGPTSDGRRKPEIFAPGCSIVSARNGNTCSTRTLTGTSMACPAVAGAGALVRQYFEEGFYPSGEAVPAAALVPSAALVRAVLLNSATDMTNIGGYPSNQEGWGRVVLEDALYFAGDARRLAMLADVRNAGGLATGQTAIYPLTVVDAAEALELTLVFTEPPAALMAGAATVNNLDLEVVSPSGATYRGNVFDTATGTSVVAGSFDAINNVETVRVGTPEVGVWSIRVRGAAVNQGRQGFALVATGAIDPEAGGAVGYHGHAVQDSPLGNGDGVVDPGETIVLPVTLRNTRSTAASNVDATLETAAAGIVLGTADAHFADILPSSLATSMPPHFRFTVDPGAACGQEIPLELAALHSGGADDSSFSLRVGEQLRSYAGTGLPATVPQTGTATSSIVIPSPLTIGDVDVSVRIAHGNIGELLVILRSPSGTNVVLHNGTDFGVANLDTAYDTLTAPDGPGSMSDLDGQPAAGTWTLTVRDVVAGTTAAGALEAWSLAIVPAGGTSCNPFACGEPLPEEVPPFLSVDVQSVSNLVFAWPAVAGATGYRIWQSTAPQGAAETLLRATSDTGHVEVGGRFDGPTLYYVVRAVNACEWEGP
jgi:subtilisin-like proprotein convertase family protein